MAEASIDINLNPGGAGGGRDPAAPRGATPPPEPRGGIGAGVTAQDQSFDALTGSGMDRSGTAEALNILSILSDISPLTRKVFLIARKVFQIQKNVAEGLQKGSQLANRNLKLGVQSGVEAEKRARRTQRDLPDSPTDSIKKSIANGVFNVKLARIFIASAKGGRVVQGKPVGARDAFGRRPPRAKDPLISSGRRRVAPLGRGAATATNAGLNASRAASIAGTRFAAVATVVGGLAIAGTVAVAAFGAVTAAINTFISAVEQFSPAIQVAKAEAQVAESLAAIREGQRAGAAGADIIESQSGFKIALMELGSEITTTFGPLISQIIDVGTFIVKLIAGYIRFIEPVYTFLSEAAQFLIDGVNVIIDFLNNIVISLKTLGLNIKIPKIETGDADSGRALAGFERLFGGPSVGLVNPIAKRAVPANLPVFGAGIAAGVRAANNIRIRP